MTRAAAAVTIAGDDQSAPQLSVAQRKLFQFAFALDATSGRYVIVNGTDVRAKKYLHADPTTGRLVLADSQDGSVRMVRLANGRISVK